MRAGVDPIAAAGQKDVIWLWLVFAGVWPARVHRSNTTELPTRAQDSPYDMSFHS